MASPTHRFLCWAPAYIIGAPFAAICGAAASFPESRPWFIRLFRLAVDWMAHNVISLSVLVFALFVVGGVWIFAIFKTADPEKPPYGDLADVLRQLMPPPVQHAHVIVPLPSADRRPSTSGVSITPDTAVSETNASSPTTTAHSPLASGLYVGMIILSAGRLQDERYLEIAIRAFNGTGRPISIASIRGRIRAGVANHDGDELPAVAWLSEHTPQPITPSSEFMIVLHQSVPPDLVAAYLEAAEHSYVSFDLRSLEIVIEAADDHTVTARLPLWDGVTMRRWDEIFTGRIVMASANISLDR